MKDAASLAAEALQEKLGQGWTVGIAGRESSYYFSRNTVQLVARCRIGSFNWSAFVPVSIDACEEAPESMVSFLLAWISEELRQAYA